MSKRILYVSSEITPYVPENEISSICRHLPQGIQEKGSEIRTFMPRYGCINERRNQLHEVIRLSGMNLIIDENDYPLIIKVASIQAARMQVYFIDNEEYFHRKVIIRDSRKKFLKDNDARMIFFCRGVLETVKKLGWAPDIIHCHGWMSYLVPMYVRTGYKDSPMFANSKIITSVYNDKFDEEFNSDYGKRAIMNDMTVSDVKDLKNSSYTGLLGSALTYSDAIIKGSETLDTPIGTAIKKSGKPCLDYHNEETYVDAYDAFYTELFQEESVLA